MGIVIASSYVNNLMTRRRSERTLKMKKRCGYYDRMIGYSVDTIDFRGVSIYLNFICRYKNGGEVPVFYINKRFKSTVKILCESAW